MKGEWFFEGLNLNEDKEAMAKMLKEDRKMAGLTLKEAGETVGISAVAVHKMENGSLSNAKTGKELLEAYKRKIENDFLAYLTRQGGNK